MRWKKCDDEYGDDCDDWCAIMYGGKCDDTCVGKSVLTSMVKTVMTGVVTCSDKGDDKRVWL